jgi:hypothetical protein
MNEWMNHRRRRRMRRSKRELMHGLLEVLGGPDTKTTRSNGCVRLSYRHVMAYCSLRAGVHSSLGLTSEPGTFSRCSTYRTFSRNTSSHNHLREEDK